MWPGRPRLPVGFPWQGGIARPRHHLGTANGGQVFALPAPRMVQALDCLTLQLCQLAVVWEPPHPCRFTCYMNYLYDFALLLFLFVNAMCKLCSTSSSSYKIFFFFLYFISQFLNLHVLKRKNYYLRHYLLLFEIAS